MNYPQSKHLASFSLLLCLSACNPAQTPVGNNASPSPVVSAMPQPGMSVSPGSQTLMPLSLVLRADASLQAFALLQVQGLCLKDIRTVETRLKLATVLPDATLMAFQAQGVRIEGQTLILARSLSAFAELVSGLKFELPGLPNLEFQATSAFLNQVGEKLASLDFSVSPGVQNKREVSILLKPAAGATGACPLLQADITGGSVLQTEGGLLQGVSQPVEPGTQPSQNPSPAPTAPVTTGLPLAPRQLQIVRRDNNSMAISWEIAELRPHTYRLLLDGHVVAADLTGTNYTFTGLQADKSYRLEVRTVIGGQTSLPSDIVGNTLVQGSSGAGGFSNGGSSGGGSTTPVQLAPTLASLAPASGPVDTLVTLSGSNFDLIPANNLVRFGTTPATVTAATATSLTVSVPAGLSTGANQVSVSVKGQTSNALPYQFLVPPVITALSPLVGPVAGGAILTITGSDFTDAIGINFGTLPATSFTVDSPTSIRATTPAQAAGVVDVSVITPGGTSANTAADDYTYQVAPVLTGLSSSAGPLAGGSNITLTGTHFTGATAVSFGSVPAPAFTLNSATSITATVPAQAAGTVDVSVATPGGTSANTSADDYTYQALPAVTGLSPTGGSTAGGTAVTLTGSNFTGVTNVRFGSTSATFTIVSDTQITTTSPAGTGQVDVSVVSLGGTSANTAADNFTYLALPAVTSLSPATQSLAGGNSVTLTGSGFTGATAVMFGNTPATSFTVNSATSITAVAPAGSAGTVNVSVTAPGGTSANVATDDYTYTQGRLYVSTTSRQLSYAPASSVSGSASAVTSTSTSAAAIQGSVDVSRNILYVAAASNNSVSIFDNAHRTNTLTRTLINVGSAVRGVAIDSQRDILYVAVTAGTLRIFDNASTLSGDMTGLGRTVTGGIAFGELSLDVANNRLYVGNDNSSQNQVIILDNASTMSGTYDSVSKRVITGAATLLSHPLSLHYQASTNKLYVGNFSGSNNVVVFANASTADGNVSPVQVLGGANTGLAQAAGITLNPSTNELIVGSASSALVAFFSNADTVTGNIAPVRTLTNMIGNPRGLTLDITR